MKIYVITEIESNVCQVDSFVFIDYDKMLIKWNELFNKHKEIIEDAEEPEEEEYILDKEHKHLSYDNGQYFVALDLDTKEV